MRRSISTLCLNAYRGSIWFVFLEPEVHTWSEYSVSIGTHPYLFLIPFVIYFNEKQVPLWKYMGCKRVRLPELTGH